MARVILRKVITEDDKCADSPTGKHEPDWHSTTTEFDGGQLYVDINCKHCGRSGCVGAYDSLAANINW